MKAPKISLNKEALQDFLTKHVEKVAIVLIGALAGYVLYGGFSTPTYEASKDPLQLNQTANQAQENVDKNHWPALSTQPERVKTTDYKQRVVVGLTPTEGQHYKFGLFNPPLIPNKQKRGAVKIYPPEQLQVTTIRAAIYENPRGGEDAWAGDANAARGAKPATTPKKTTSKDADILGNAPRPESAMPNPAMTGMEAQKTGAVSPTFFDKHVDGYRPNSAVKPQGDTSAGPPHGVTREFNVVTAVVPFRKQVEHFDEVLANAEGYDLKRDQPNYLLFRVERAEVGPDPAAPPVWQSLKVREIRRALMESLWAGNYPEVVDSRYVHEQLTFPLPPALLARPTIFAGHRLVPNLLLKLEKETTKKNASGSGENPLGAESPEALSAAPTPMANPIPEVGRPATGSPEVPRGTSPKGTAAAPAKPPEPPVLYKLVRFLDFQTQPGKVYHYRFQVLAEDPNHPKEPSQKPADQILDASVVARNQKLDADEQASGQRVFWLESPWSEVSPKSQVLTDKRYLASHVRHEAIKKTYDMPRPALESPSDAGGDGLKVDPTKLVLTPNSEPSGTMLVVVWDRPRAAEIGGNPETPDESTKTTSTKSPVPPIFRSTVLNFNRDAHALRPDTLELKTLKNYRFQTNAYVVDLRATDILPWPKRGKIPQGSARFTPSEILVMDHEGNFTVRNEVDDTEEFRRLTLDGEVATSGQ